MDIAKIAALAAQAAATSDQTKTTAGGGDYVPPAEGACMLRLVGYIELGKQAGEYKGVANKRDKVRLEFEVSGPKHPPIEIDGVLKPIIIAIEENLSLNEKAKFKKLFNRLNYAGSATHAAELVATTEAYKGRIVHRKYKRRDNTEGVAVELYDKATEQYTIEPPRRMLVDEDSGLETGEFAVIKVAPATTKPRVFLWNYADLDQWASIFVDGEYPERKDKDGKVTAPAKSKNVLQAKIKLATNFVGSPIHAAILASGGDLSIPDAESGRDLGDAPSDDDAPDTTAAPAVTNKPLEGTAWRAALDALADVV
jgi:hypothetical protein